ncbi:family 43 glycosylhydrolase [Dysgonomonas sp. Marseille-P4677]|uniref:family 43 glycosylhydrolase n=1 Tax=Dysgonomonas sp. Marseille-P4677 TaxID=2364790 RepID=UPI00191468D3|nr:family 43 glycosylhydrolase [Dysgonomonas sp. Marseille-P4677]MBK5720118.1 family 43 glycosylhydrolase [Dysgonomonas sp. Marseille-P4677]
MPRKILYILFVLLLPILLYAQEVKFNTPGAGNPIIPGYFADPTVRKFGDTYYIYATTDGTGLGVGPAQVWKSKDFVNWTIAPMNWPDAHQIWAPDVMQGTDGKYYHYYSQACKIFCGVSDNPTGPWKNILGADEAVLIPDRYVKMSITLDAQSFIDDDGSTYLYWGTWGIYKDHGCGVGKLSADMKSLVDTALIPNTQATEFFEAPYVFKRNDIYYLTYSSGSCHDHTYRVQYATSKIGPMGPFEFADNNPILATNSDTTIHGPGHHSILKEGDDYYIVYHRHNIPQSTRGFFRQIAADKLIFDKNGRILKIEAGHKGIGYLQKDSNPYKDIAFGAKVKASSYYDENFKPKYAVDNNNATLWRAKNCSEKEWIEIDLGKAQSVKRIWTQFEHATSFYQYLYETSTDGKNWTVFSDKQNNTLAGSPMTDHGDIKAKYIRLTISGNEMNGLFPAVWNIKVFSEGKDPFPANEMLFNRQAATAVPKRRGLLFEINANDYQIGELAGRITNNRDTKQGFNAISMAVPIKDHKSKKAFAFNGYQQFKSDFGLPETMTGNAPYSVSAWIASPYPKENECIIDINESYGELEKIIFGYGTSDRSGITMHHGWYEDMGIKDMETSDEWKHIAVTFDGYKERIYINGIFVKEKDIFLRVGKSERLTLGTKFDGEHQFRGYLHSLQFYDIPLKQEQITELYNR